MSRILTGSVLALLLVPILIVFHQGFFTTGYSGLEQLSTSLLPGYIANTLLLAALTGSVTLVLGAGSAFFVVFFSFPGRRLLDTALVLPLVLPSYLVAMVYRELSHASPWFPSVESLWGAVGVLAVTLYPYVYLLSRSSFQRQAMHYIEVGQALGLARHQIAIRALLPLSAPAVLLGVLLVIIEVVSDFGTTSILGVRTLTTAVHRIWFDTYDPGLAMQVALLSTLVPLLLVAGYGLMVRRRKFVNPTNRPRQSQAAPLARGWRLPVLLFLSLPVALGFAGPVLVLLGWAAEAFAKFSLASLYQDLFHSLVLSVGTTAGALLLAIWFAVNARFQGPGWTLATLMVVSLNYVIPAIVLAVALLYLSGLSYDTTVGAWLADSMLLVAIATTLRYSAFAYFSVESGFKSIPSQIDEAVECAGHRRSRGVLRVLLPMIRNSLLIGGMLVFVLTAKELTLSLVLQPFGFRTLALSIYYFADIEVHGPAAIYTLCLILVVIYPVLSINRWLHLR